MKQAIIKSAKSLWRLIPLLIGILLLIGLISSFLTKDIYLKIFGHGSLINAIIGGLAGSISAGSPINSYVLGGEFLKQGVGLIAVTAFLVSWVTVGLIQIPIEAKFLGMKFAIWRNLLSFILAIVAALITTLLLKI